MIRFWTRGKPAGALTFLLIAVLVMGGLAWVTRAALALEEAQNQAVADHELADRVRLALWRLDSLVFPVLAKEASRPYNHYRPLYVQPASLRKDAASKWAVCTTYQPSPLLHEVLPDWIQLHFQSSPGEGVISPQVPTGADADWVSNPSLVGCIDNYTPDRQRSFAAFSQHVDHKKLLADVEKQQALLLYAFGQYVTDENPPVEKMDALREELEAQTRLKKGADGGPGRALNSNTLLPGNAAGLSRDNFNRDSEFQKRFQSKGQAESTQRQEFYVQPQQTVERGGAAGVRGGGGGGQGAAFPGRPGSEADKAGALPMPPVQVAHERVLVKVGPLTPLWVSLNEHEEALVLARKVEIGDREAFVQGFVLDWVRLQAVLLAQVEDLFPDARLVSVRDDAPPHPERTMTGLPLELIPGEGEGMAQSLGWTPLRIGLLSSWLAALVALGTVGLGGWSLLDLSERRIRFVSAVTHELRTPLTTLRLYLDMLTSGMVKEERQKGEYLTTLHHEAERLHRLIGNVLDFSRLENHRTQPQKVKVVIADVVEQVRATWNDRCRDAGKELIIDNQVQPDAVLETDPALLQQILANLLDNACKYSRHAADARLWLRVRGENGQVVWEVEDRGPGVPANEQRSIFRPFRRGQCVETTASGVGLGLALADRWARLLGGTLTLCPNGGETGARFRLVVG